MTEFGRRALPVVAAIIAATAVHAGAAFGTGSPPSPEAQVVDAVSGVSASPSRIEADVFDSAFTAQVTLTNHDAVDHDLRLEATALSHDLVGSPSFTPPAPNNLRVVPAAATVPAGGRVEVTVSGDVPTGAGTYGGITVTFDVAPGVDARVGVLVLVRGRQPWTVDFTARDVQVAVAGDRWDLAAVADNIGTVHDRVSLHIELRRGSNVVAVADLDGEIAVPGSGRRLRGSIPAPPGATPEGLVAVVTPVPESGLASPRSVRVPVQVVASLDDADDVSSPTTTTLRGATSSSTPTGSGVDLGSSDSDDDDQIPPLLAAVAAAMLGIVGASTVGRLRRERDR